MNISMVSKWHIDGIRLFLTLPEGNYTGANLATCIQDLINGFAINFDFELLYHPARGSITI